MEALFTKDFAWLWMVALAAALFYPVRQLIWVLYVRRAERRARDETGPAERGVDEAERARLRTRAGFTAVLLCFVFAFLYISYLFRDMP